MTTLIKKHSVVSLMGKSLNRTNVEAGKFRIAVRGSVVAMQALSSHLEHWIEVLNAYLTTSERVGAASLPPVMLVFGAGTVAKVIDSADEDASFASSAWFLADFDRPTGLTRAALELLTQRFMRRSCLVDDYAGYAAALKALRNRRQLQGWARSLVEHSLDSADRYSVASGAASSPPGLRPASESGAFDSLPHLFDSESADAALLAAPFVARAGESWSWLLVGENRRLRAPVRTTAQLAMWGPLAAEIAIRCAEMGPDGRTNVARTIQLFEGLVGSIGSRRADRGNTIEGSIRLDELQIEALGSVLELIVKPTIGHQRRLSVNRNPKSAELVGWSPFEQLLLQVPGVWESVGRSGDLTTGVDGLQAREDKPDECDPNGTRLWTLSWRRRWGENEGLMSIYAWPTEIECLWPLGFPLDQLEVVIDKLVGSLGLSRTSAEDEMPEFSVAPVDETSDEPIPLRLERGPASMSVTSAGHAAERRSRLHMSWLPAPSGMLPPRLCRMDVDLITDATLPSGLVRMRWPRSLDVSAGWIAQVVASTSGRVIPTPELVREINSIEHELDRGISFGPDIRQDSVR